MGLRANRATIEEAEDSPVPSAGSRGAAHRECMTMRITLDESCRFGLGVDSLLQQARGEALTYTGTTDSDGGQTVSSDVKVITTQQELVETFDISAAASVRYGFSGADPRMSFAEEHAVNDASVYLALHTTVMNPPQSMVGPKLTDAAARIYGNDPEEFRRDFGDSYIDEIYKGGALTILYMFHTRDEKSKQSVSASLHAAVNAVAAGGDLTVSVNSGIEAAKSQSEMELQAYITGGRGVVTPTGMSESLDLYKNFPATVQNAGTPYFITAKSWEDLPLPPGPTWVETLARRDTIETAGKYVLDAIEARSRIQYILENPHQYIDPNIPALEQARAQVNSLIGKWGQAAHDCNADISMCSLEGLDFPVISWPQRVEALDPLSDKVEKVRLHDSRAAGIFGLSAFPDPPLDVEYDEDPRREGRWRLAVNHEGRPVGGVYWTPETGAHIVYGYIFDRYQSLNGAQGRLGYPTSDEEFFNPAIFSGHEGDRLSRFEHGMLWWNCEDNAVSDRRPLTKWEIELFVHHPVLVHG